MVPVSARVALVLPPRALASRGIPEPVHVRSLIAGARSRCVGAVLCIRE